MNVVRSASTELAASGTRGASGATESTWIVLDVWESTSRGSHEG